MGCAPLWSPVCLRGRKSRGSTVAKGGELSLGEVLRVRIRYFTEGVVLRSRIHVNEVFAAFRDRFGPRRKTGAGPMRGLTALAHLCTLRDLRVNVLG